MINQYAAWSVANNLELLTMSDAGHTYPVLAELTDSGYRSINTISLEFFNQELQKVDTSNSYSIKAFSEQFGFMFSPLYPSKVLALRSRDKKKNETTWEEDLAHFIPDATGKDDPRVVIDMNIANFENPLGGNKSIADYRSTGKANSYYFAPTIYANDTFRKNPRYGAIVSISELAYTIRQLQTSTSLIAAYEAGLKDDEMVEYLFRSPALQHSLPQNLTQDMFYSMVFDDIPMTSSEVVVESQSSELSDESLAKHHRVYLNMQFDELYTALSAFIRKAKTALSLQNDGIPLSPNAPWANHFTNSKFEPITEGSLLEAVLENFDAVRASKHDWHRCKYKGCGRVFKFHKEYDPSKRFRQAEYCKQSCRVMDANSQS